MTVAAADTVVVFNGTTHSVVNQIPVGTAPSGMDLDIAHQVLYVANNGSNNVSVINASTDRIVASIGVGMHPTGVVFDPRNHSLYVANYGSANVTRIDASRLSVLASIAVGPQPFAMGEVGGIILVSQRSTGRVTEISESRNIVLANVSVGRDPVAILSTGNGAFVANRGSDTVTVLYFTTGVYSGQSTVAVGSSPEGIASDPFTGTVYVVNSGSSNLTVLYGGIDYDLATSVPDVGAGVDYSSGLIYLANGISPRVQLVPVEFGRSSTLTSAVGGNGTIAVDRTAGLILFASDLGFLYELDSATHLLVFKVHLGGHPNGLAVDPVAGMAFVSLSSAAKVAFVRVATGQVAAMASVGPAPGGVAVVPLTSEVYVANFKGDSVSVLAESSGALVATIPVGTGPRGVAWDPLSRTLAVANSGSNNVSRIDPTRHLVTGTTTVGAGPAGVLFDPADNRTLVSNSLGSTVSVLNGTHRVGSIAAGGGPDVMAFDPIHQHVFVVNAKSHNLSQFEAANLSWQASYRLAGIASAVPDPVTGDLMLSVTTPPQILELAQGAWRYESTNSEVPLLGAVQADPAGRSVWVADAYGAEALHEGSGALLATLPASPTPVKATGALGRINGFAFDPLIDRMLVGRSGTTAVLNATTNQVVSNWTIGSISAGVYEPTNRQLFVSVGSTVYVLNASTLATIATTGGGGTAMALDPTFGSVLSLAGTNLDLVATASSTLVQTIGLPTGTSPHALAVDPRTGFALVLEGQSHYLDVVNLTAGSVARKTSVGNGPAFLATDPGLGEYFVANIGSESLSVVNASTLKLLGTIALPITPNWEIFDPTSNEIVVSASAIGRLLFVGPANRTAFAAWAVESDPGPAFFGNPTSGTFDPPVLTWFAEGYVACCGHPFYGLQGPYAVADGSPLSRTHLFVTDSGANAVVNARLSYPPPPSFSLAPVGLAPRGMVEDPATGRLIVANYGSDSVSILTSYQGNTTAVFPVGVGPAGIAVETGTGKFFVTNSGSDNVSAVGASGVYGSVSVGVSPRGIAYDPLNHFVYVANAGSSTVTVFDAGNLSVVRTIPVPSGPHDVVYDPYLGEIFVSSPGTDAVVVIVGLSVFATFNAGGGPQGLSFGPSGELWVADSTGNAYSVYTSDH